MNSNELLEQRIARAVEAETPNVWDKILLRIEEETQNMTQDAALVTPLAPKRRAVRTWLRLASAMAAVLVLTCVCWGYVNLLPESTVNLDVNPSIELVMNRSEKVLSVTPLNEDAVQILDGMDLANTDLNVAVNALIGSMVKNGYLSELKNSILITVNSADSAKSLELQERLTEEVNALLGGYELEGAILSQTVSEDERLQGLASEHEISLGKAALVDLLVSQDETLDFSSVAALPINDINLLIAAKNASIEGIASSGSASSASYLSAQEIRQIACTHAGVTPESLTASEIEFDYENGRMVYETEFHCNGFEFEYEIDAMTGEILRYHHMGNRPVGNANGNGNLPSNQTTPPTQTTPSNESTSSATNGTIGLDKATELALAAAGVSMDDIVLVKQACYEKNGISICDIIFLSDTCKYTYHINAITGDVEAQYRNERHRGQNGHHNAGGNGRFYDTSSFIGIDAALSAACSHAGIQGEVSRLEWELDEDDGSYNYELEFVYNGMQYEYRIDALSGSILEWDIDED